MKGFKAPASALLSAVLAADVGVLIAGVEAGAEDLALAAEVVAMQEEASMQALMPALGLAERAFHYPRVGYLVVLELLSTPLFLLQHMGR